MDGATLMNNPGQGPVNNSSCMACVTVPVYPPSSLHINVINVVVESLLILAPFPAKVRTDTGQQGGAQGSDQPTMIQKAQAKP
jgi:hypothetical protein